jgi:hypothetical protein
MNFIFLVEGKTERLGLPAFLKKWLDPRLSQPVGIRPRNMGGCSDFISDAVGITMKELADPANRDLIAVIGLLDLYGPQKFYPNGVASIADRCQWGRRFFEEKVANPRFKMYFAVHETEAWLLSGPELFPRQVAEKLPGKIREPEKVDFDEPPAKLLDKLYYQYLKRHYNKVVYGNSYFRALDPNIVYCKCPYFATMMDELEEMAHRAGL